MLILNLLACFDRAKVGTDRGEEAAQPRASVDLYANPGLGTTSGSEDYPHCPSIGSLKAFEVPTRLLNGRYPKEGHGEGGTGEGLPE